MGCCCINTYSYAYYQPDMLEIYNNSTVTIAITTVTYNSIITTTVVTTTNTTTTTSDAFSALTLPSVL